MLTEAFIARVKAATDLMDLVSDYTEVTPAGTNLWQARCPHPDHNDSTPSFRIRHNEDDSWSWWCGGCHSGPKDIKHKNYGTDCFAFVSWMSDYQGSKHKIGWREAVEILAKRAGITMEAEKYAYKYKLISDIAKARHEAVRAYDNVMDYLHDRGLTDETINKWMIGVNTQKEMDAFVTRVSFPLFMKYNRIGGFSSRILPWEDQDLPKYKNSSNSPWFDKGAYLYGAHNYDSNFEELRITEGAMDVVMADQAGARNVVGTLGTSFTKHHAAMIKNMKVCPCFCMDGDAAGLKGISRAVDMLAEVGVYSRVCILPPGKDLADLAIELGEELEDYLVDHTLMYWEYLLQESAINFSTQLTQLKSKYASKIMLASKGAKTPEDRMLMKSYVKERFGINL